MNRRPAPEAEPEVAPSSGSEKGVNDVSDGELEQLLYGVDEPDKRDWDESSKLRR